MKKKKKKPPREEPRKRIDAPIPMDRIDCCPLCERTLPTMSKQKLVAKNLQQFNAHMEAQVAQAIAEAKTGKQGYAERESGLIVPAALRK